MKKFLALALIFALSISFQAAAQQSPLLIILTVQTGEDGSADDLMFTLLNADPNGAPLDERVVAEPNDLLPGGTGLYNLFFDGVDYCDAGGFEIRLAGTDSWSPESIQITIDDVVLYDDPEAEVFAPLTPESYPINGRWTRTAAYLSRCAPDQLTQVPTLAPTAQPVIVTPPMIATNTLVATTAPTPVTCPGFLPSRLVMGGEGRVTPGAFNNLRANPNRSAAVLGQIAPGETFTVLVGPGCDPEGIAWWQVTYNGQTGWTAEGMGSEYYLEPVTQ